MIELSQIQKTYDGKPVIRDLSLSIPGGEVTVLIGPSGCGKTTLLEMINGLRHPDSGRIVINGQDINSTDMISLRRRIGYVIQEVGLFPHYKVFDNIAIVPRLLKWEETRIRERVQELLQLVNISRDLLGKHPAQLSGGQQQRVGVARALAADPEYLLMDEPFAALDPINRSRLQEEFSNIQQKLRKTVVFVTHDMDEALRLGDKIAILHEGRLLQYDRPLNIIKNPANEFVRNFIGADRFLKMLRLLPLKDIWEQCRREPPVQIRKTGATEQAVSQDAPEYSLPFRYITDAGGKYLGYTEISAGGGNSFSDVRSDIPVIHLHTDLESALAALLIAPHAALPVVDEQQRLTGMLTLDALREVMLQLQTKQ